VDLRLSGRLIPITFIFRAKKRWPLAAADRWLPCKLSGRGQTARNPSESSEWEVGGVLRRGSAIFFERMSIKRRFAGGGGGGGQEERVLVQRSLIADII
jgi:hypothetical protein